MAIKTIAATPTKIFLLPPLVDSVPLPKVPPKFNVGAVEAVCSDGILFVPVATSSTEISGFEMAGAGTTAAGFSMVTALGFTSRAGAGALAAPEVVTENPRLGGAAISGGLDIVFCLGSAAVDLTIGAESTSLEAA